ncbi:MAG TPA: hypothetical protein VEO95_10500, partial [Chthoniobacteraceae bacterium]|nr:hypothetical protein [Chthoniobacteraceae bacterium]
MGGCDVAWGCWLVAVWLWVNGAALARAPERPFFAGRPALQFIEQRLPPDATVIVPPDPAGGRHVASDTELRDAFSRALEYFLVPPATFASESVDLIGEVCRERPAQAVHWIAIAAAAILRHAPPGAEDDLERAVAGAAAANPQAAGVIVSQVIHALAAAAESRIRPLEMATAGRF